MLPLQWEWILSLVVRPKIPHVERPKKIFFLMCLIKKKKEADGKNSTNKSSVSHSSFWLFATPRTVTHQAFLSMKFSRQECCSGLPFPCPQRNQRLILKMSTMFPRPGGGWWVEVHPKRVQNSVHPSPHPVLSPPQHHQPQAKREE